jgi:hypothetical protein
VLFEESEPSSSAAINTMKQVYRSCMDTSELAVRKSSVLLAKLEELGHWPVVHGDKWTSDKFDLSALLVGVGKSRSVPNVLFY